MNNRSYVNMKGVVLLEEGILLDELDEDELIEMAELFKMFGDSTRIKILYLLLDSEKCVQEITDAAGATQSAISHQLRLLKQARLVRSRRQGKQVCYSLADDHVKTILGMAKDHLEE